MEAAGVYRGGQGGKSGRQLTSEVILWVLRWYLQFPVSYLDLELVLRDCGWCTYFGESVNAEEPETPGRFHRNTRSETNAREAKAMLLMKVESLRHSLKTLERLETFFHKIVGVGFRTASQGGNSQTESQACVFR